MGNFLNRKDLFYVELGKWFIPDHIENFYSTYVNRMPSFIESPRKLVESTIQSITIPSYSYDAVNQMTVDTFNKNGISSNYRTSLNAQELSEKTLTLNFKTLNGYINYWILQDTFFEHISMQNKNTFVGDISLRILDIEGYLMFTRVYKDCNFIGISEFEIAYSDNIQTFETFNITISYSNVETKFANAGKPSNFGNPTESKSLI
jgi:hypothetical protein